MNTNYCMVASFLICHLPVWCVSISFHLYILIRQPLQPCCSKNHYFHSDSPYITTSLIRWQTPGLLPFLKTLSAIKGSQTFPDMIICMLCPQRGMLKYKWCVQGFSFHFSTTFAPSAEYRSIDFHFDHISVIRWWPIPAVVIF